METRKNNPLFWKGYKKGVKETELTVEDIRLLISLEARMMDEYTHAQLVEMGEQNYYKELLKRYKEAKQTSKSV